MTTALVAAVIAGTCLAGFVQGLSGFAFGLVAMSVWAWTVEPQLAGPLVVWGSWVCQLMSVGRLRRGFAWRRVLPFLLGGALGVPLGVWLLRYMDPRLFRGAVGLILVLYCSAMLLLARLPPLSHGGAPADAAVGWLSGVMGGLGGFTGPPVTLWCLLRRWGRDEQRATFQAFHLGMHSLTLGVYTVTGTLTTAILPLFALIVPVAILPTLAGFRLYLRLGERGFDRLVLVLLLGSGLAMLASLRAA